jgi:hypothetical protein
MSNRVLLPLALLASLLAGCSLLPPTVRRSLVEPYKPINVYLRQAVLPQNIRRVAVLPIPQSRDNTAQAEAVELLQPLLIDELNKRKTVEVIALTTAQVQELTGKASWTPEENLPHDFFERLRDKVGCDAVLFASLTTFESYPPLRTGWKARLIDCAQHQTWWAVDEVFDAGMESVAAAAEAYARTGLSMPNPLLTDAGILHSPRRFGQYTANAVAGTLPER